MHLRRISVIALSNRDFSTLEEKLLEAVGWLEIAAAEKAELVVLPELLNRFCGDGAGNARALPAREVALHHWEDATATLLKAARRLGLWLTVPVTHYGDQRIHNSFHLVSPAGETVWRFDKLSPTPEELAVGIRPAEPTYFDWNGIKLGGAICFDTCYPEQLEAQARAGVQLLLIPSMWPGGSQLNTLCKLSSLRVALSYPAWSRIIDIDGREVVEGGYRHETLRFGFGAPVYTATLNFDRMALYGNHNQEKMAAIREKYGSRVHITFDQGNCLWFLESRDTGLAEADLAAEYGLVVAADYFADCRRRIREVSGAGNRGGVVRGLNN